MRIIHPDQRGFCEITVIQCGTGQAKTGLHIFFMANQMFLSHSAFMIKLRPPPGVKYCGLKDSTYRWSGYKIIKQNVPEGSDF